MYASYRSFKRTQCMCNRCRCFHVSDDVEKEKDYEKGNIYYTPLLEFSQVKKYEDDKLTQRMMIKEDRHDC